MTHVSSEEAMRKTVDTNKDYSFCFKSLKIKIKRNIGKCKYFDFYIFIEKKNLLFTYSK